MRPTVYRAFNANDELLYVGVSMRAWGRIPDHRDKEWWTEIARIELQHFESMDAAGEAEITAIQDESPKYNVRRPGTRISEDMLAQRRASRERRKREAEQRRQERERTHFSTGLGFVCTECEHTPAYLPKGKPIVGGECPKCGNATIAKKAKAA